MHRHCIYCDQQNHQFDLRAVIIWAWHWCDTNMIQHGTNTAVIKYQHMLMSWWDTGTRALMMQGCTKLVKLCDNTLKETKVLHSYDACMSTIWYRWDYMITLQWGWHFNIHQSQISCRCWSFNDCLSASHFQPTQIPQCCVLTSWAELWCTTSSLNKRA